MFLPCNVFYMKKHSLFTLFLILFVFIILSQPVVIGQGVKTPPNTRQDNYREILHGVEIVDPYRWLEDQNSAETREWINAQNEYTQSLLANHSSRQSIKYRI